MRPLNFFALILLLCSLTVAGTKVQAQAEDTSLWEYGFGLGYVHYEHYPASDQFSNLFLPFPSFQYRGRILRADDREGTRAYLFKGERWSFEMAGGGYPALKSDDNEARRNMDDLPWMLQLGPQLVVKLHPDLEFKLAVFQALSTDFSLTKTAGLAYEGKLQYRWDTQFGSEGLGVRGLAEQITSFGQLTWSLKGGNQDFLKTYFDVPSQFATSIRPAFSARPGFLSSELSYFQSIRSGRASFYLGAAITDYAGSANRESPLHKSDRNVTYLVGLTYVLGESQRPSIKLEDTEGLINRFEKRINLRP